MSMKRHYFNLIELMLALGVIVVGLVSVMALFPIGANANRDAMAENYSSMAAEQVLNLLAQHIRKPPPNPAIPTNSNWVEFISGVNPKIEPCYSNSELETYMGTWNTFKFEDFTVQSPLDLTPSPPERPVILQKDVSIFNEGIGIRNEYEDSTGNFLSDFEAVAVLWQEQISIVSGSPIPEKVAVALNLEISWPAQLPYARRQKARYRLEVFNPNPIP